MDTILLTIENNIATITLNRPDKFNAFNRTMALALQNAIANCQTDNNVKAIVITGAGKAFSAGQDIAELVGEAKMEMNKILSEHYNPIVTAIKNCTKPIIAKVNGVAAGAGANIALCCDVVVATYSASFIQAFSKIGLIPDSGGTYTLPRLIGWQKASAIMLLGDKIIATEADTMGMIYKAYPDEVFDAECTNIATKLAQLPSVGLALTKQALQQSYTNSWQQQLQTEDTLQQQAAATYDYNEGITAFLEKRKPVFIGK